MSTMVVRVPGGDVRVFTGSFTAGTDPGCDLVLTGKYTSARHALFLRQHDGWYVTDLASANGTWLNDVTGDGKRLYLPDARVHGPVLLRRGDRVRAGHDVLTVVPVA